MENFQFSWIPRSDLKAAPYNPRTIDPAARKRLKENIERLGLHCPLTWNSVTGNIVGGHQRLSILDTLEGTPDYMVPVAVIQLSPEEERNQNVFLNNEYAQGVYDGERITELLEGNQITLDSSGFSAAAYELLAQTYDVPVERIHAVLPEPADPVSKMIRDAQSMERAGQSAPAQHNAANDSLKERRREMTAQNDTRYYLIVRFSGIAERLELLRRLGLNHESRTVHIRQILKTHQQEKK